MATPTTAAWLKKYDRKFLHCRDTGHAWSYHTARRTTTGYQRTLRCIQCETIKSQELDKQGYILKTSYSYPEKYALPLVPMTKDNRALIRKVAV